MNFRRLKYFNSWHELIEKREAEAIKDIGKKGRR
jgi:hypothetical protein